MQILKHKTHIDFIGKRRPAIFVSSVLNAAIIIGLFVFGLNLGVDFAGGTVVELKFNRNVNAQEVRQACEHAGMKDVSVQGIGSADEHSYLVRLGGVTQLTQASLAKAEEALRGLGSFKNITGDIDNGLINLRAEGPLTTEAIRKAVE